MGQDPVEYIKNMLLAYEAAYGRDVAQSLAAYYVPYLSQMGIDVSGIMDRPAHQGATGERGREREVERGRDNDRDRRDERDRHPRRRSASPRQQRK